jgi:hypothetical protein
MEKCKNKAECVYPWAGKLMKACYSQARTMHVLANVIGSPIEIQELSKNNEDCMHMDDLKPASPVSPPVGKLKDPAGNDAGSGTGATMKLYF